MVKKVGGLILVVAIIVVVLALAVFPEQFRYLVDSAMNPWAHSLTGQPTLTGRWRGQVNFEGRPGREMHLEIRRDPLVSHRRATRGKFARHGAFTGTAQMPNEQGVLINYEVWGRANRDGSQITLHLRDLNRQPSPKEQPLLQLLHGSWGGTTLQLDGQYALDLYDGHSSKYESGAPTPAVTATLQKE